MTECEVTLTDSGEIWMRQARDAHCDQGKLSGRAFEQSSQDAGELSGTRRSKQSARAAHEQRNEMRPGSSDGTWGVSVRELQSEQLACVDDSACEVKQPLPKGHAFVDLRQVPKPRERVVRVRLAHYASERGRLWPKVERRQR